MYRNCIFCSAAFGANDVLEAFPVGRQIAFDSARGRLWAVCPVCARWNLSPIEDRWEPVEQAEKLFRDARLRVQSENVGLARMPDGTRLVRVGEAVSGELAAWRYGTQLLRRRRQHLVLGGVSIAAGAVAIGGLSAMGVGLGSVLMGNMFIENYRQRRVLYRLDDPDPPVAGRTRKPSDLVIRHWQLEGMSLDYGEDGRVEVLVRDARRKEPGWRGHVHPQSKDVAIVKGDAARGLLGRAMVHINAKGATRSTLSGANRLLSDAGSADRILREAGAGGAALGKRAGRDPEVLKGHWALAFEMALNEDSERRALEGELAALEAAWREAEEIAAIADTLPGAALVNRLLERLR